MENEEMKETSATEDEVVENADLMADADRASGSNEDPNKIKINFQVKLSKAYDDMSGNLIDTVDLSGLENLTTMDAQEVDRIVGKLGHVPKNKWKDTLYTKHVAVKATGLPVEFFNALLWKDMEDITSTVMLYFLFS